MNRRKIKKVPMVILIIFSGLLVIIAIGYIVQMGQGGSYYDADGTFSHVSTKSSFQFAMDHPAFKGFGQYILPWEDGFIVTVTKPLSFERLLPYLGAWDPDTVVGSINFLIDEVNRGKTIFYPIYSAEEIAQDESKRATGLFFIQGDEGAPFAFGDAGGGFTSVALIQEGFPIAQRLHEKGYNIFILKYRVGVHQGDVNSGFIDRVDRANVDMAKAFRFILDNADKFKISTKDYSVWGFSAGGRLAANWSANIKYGYAQHGFPAPAVAVLAYPGLPYDYSEKNPPTFVTVCADDEIISVKDLDEFVQSLMKFGVDVEYKKFAHGKHGFGTGVGTDANGWMDYAVDFWKKYQQ